MTEQRKAKRRLTDINFAKEGSHVALVHSSQGGSANEWHEAVVMKATDDVNDEFLEKATMVRVTLPFDDFLEKFFGVWSEQADMLTEILGFSDEEDMEEKDKSEMSWEEYKAYCEQEKQDFIDSVEILKSIKQGEVNVEDLNAKSYLSVLLTQSLFEQHQEDIEKAVSTSKEKKVQIEVELQKAKDDLAAKDVEIQKAVADLQKATADLAAMKQELDVLKAANEKAKDDARMDALKEVASDEEAVDLFKSTKALDDAAFAVVLKSLKAANAKEEEIFKEKGVSNGQATVEEIDPVRRTLLAKYHSQNK